jgi:cellulose biosynthesis protein BcsQ
MVPAPLSLRMLDELLLFVERTGWRDLRLLAFFSMVDRRKALHDETMTQARARFPSLLATEVPYWSEIERMSVRRAPIAAYAPQSAAARIYESLWAEVSRRMAAA